MRGLLLSLSLLAIFLFHCWPQNATSDVFERIGHVVKIDNSRLIVIGSNRIGEQLVQLKHPDFLQPIETINLISGSLEYDEYYQMGDKVLFAYQLNDKGELLNARILSHYRLPTLAILLVIFAIALLCYARRVGFRSLCSFAGALAIIWYWLVPTLLAGTHPVFATLTTVLLLSVLIILSVAGVTIKGISALLGTLAGLAITTVICIVTSGFLSLDGMTQPFAQLILFESGMHLNLLHIYYAAVIIGASGAAMDVAMEMAATLQELKEQNPAMTQAELLRSGFKVGSAVIGTMTTTLLLAYSGGFLTMMMLFVHRDVSVMQLLNMKVMAAEISRTLVGSIAMVIVAPLTAWIGAWLLCRSSTKKHCQTPIKWLIYWR